MPRVESVGTALPRYVLRQSDVREFARSMFGQVFGSDIDRLVQVFDNTEIEERHFCVPIEWFGSNRALSEKNALYTNNALELARRAVEQCLEQAAVHCSEIDCIIMVSTTGLATPSLDARLCTLMPFRSTVRRLPVWGLGCAGGAAALSWARTICTAEPGLRVLCVVVELCGLTFIRNDLSKAALIATSLFADGAAAVLVEGDAVAPRSQAARPYLMASHSATLPDSLDVMGWDICDEGFRIVISRDIPSIVGSFVRPETERFLSAHSLSVRDIPHFVLHPGGARVLDAYQTEFGIERSGLRHACAVLKHCGNMSAVTVLFVLQRFMEERTTGYGLLAALGPGFSTEQLLLQWKEAAAVA